MNVRNHYVIDCNRILLALLIVGALCISLTLITGCKNEPQPAVTSVTQ